MDKIYKYTSVTSAIKILEDNSVILSKPYEFNDPFDSIIDFNDKETEKAISIIGDYYVINIYFESLKNRMIVPTFKESIINLLLKVFIKVSYFIFRIIKHYGKIPFSRSISNYIMRKSGKSNYKRFIELKKQKEESLIFKIKMIGIESQISCFSEDSNSILLWSHYADKHRGVCIEFERPNSRFYKVSYSKNRYIFNLEKTARLYLLYLISHKRVDNDDKKLVKWVMKPFLTKSKKWKYEKEVRCDFSKDSNEIFKKTIYDKEKKQNIKKNFYKMPTNITKVIFGCKVDRESKEYKDLIELICKQENKIDIKYKKISDKFFALEEE